MDPLIGGTGQTRPASPDTPGAAAAHGAVQLTTRRLLLCDWTPGATDVLARLSGDPDTMRFFHHPLPTPAQIAEMAERHSSNIAAGRPALYAVHLRAEGTPCIGFVGLATPRFEAAFMPCVEIGWRLAKPAWGHGYATEAARECLRHGFETLGLDEIVSFTAVVNEPSRAVMRRLGMRHDPAEDFLHPNVPAGDPIEPHVLYRLTRDEWRTSLGT